MTFPWAIGGPAGENGVAKEREGRIGDLFRLYHRDLVRFVTRIVGSAADAEEIAQDTYLKVSQRGSQTAAIEHPKTYLFAAARNTAMDHAARSRSWLLPHDQSAAEKVAAAEPLPDAVLHHRRRLERMSAALNELPAPCRRAFLLNKLHGMGHAEIARDLDVSVSMVEKHIMRALAHCRDRLREDEE